MPASKNQVCLLQKNKKLQTNKYDPETKMKLHEIDLRCRTIHRCLVCLGDLARYREIHSEETRKDWTLSERYYYMAVNDLGEFE